jgi:hypothetical protein
MRVTSAPKPKENFLFCQPAFYITSSYKIYYNKQNRKLPGIKLAKHVIFLTNLYVAAAPYPPIADGVSIRLFIPQPCLALG